MTNLKAIFGVLLAVVMAAVFAVASSAENTGSSPRSGDLHLTKDCVGTYFGHAGEFCTIESSNLNTIDVGAKVVYTSAAGATSLDSDIVLYTGPGNSAFGHVTLDFLTSSGVVTLSGGTGQFRGFHANAAVTYSSTDGLWHWDGTYSFTPPGHDE